MQGSTGRARVRVLVMAVLAVACADSPEPVLGPALVPQASLRLGDFVVLNSDVVPVTAVTIFTPASQDAANVRAIQNRLRVIQELLEALDIADPARMKLGDEELELRKEFGSLIPMDSRYSVGGPDRGAGTVHATVSSMDQMGGLIELHPLPLVPDGTGAAISLKKIVAVLAGGIIKSGEFDDILFIETKDMGFLEVAADGYLPTTVLTMKN